MLGSPAVMAGYWHDPAATAAAFTPAGSCAPATSGGSTTAGAFAWPVGPCERYVRGGYNVHPMEVEAVLADHPEVAAVAVVGRPDPVMGEVGVAVVVPSPGQRHPTLD